MYKSNKIPQIDKFDLYKDLIYNEDYDPLMSSHILSSKTLRIYRSFVSLFCIVITCFGFDYLFAYTNWNWILVTIYFTILSCLHWYYWYCPKKNSDNVKQDTEIHVQLFPKLRYIAVVAFLIECANTIIIVVVVWTVLVPLTPSKDIIPMWFNFIAFVLHSFNLIFIYFDMWINNIKFNSIHFAYPAFCLGVIYVTFQWIFVQLPGGVCPCCICVSLLFVIIYILAPNN